MARNRVRIERGLYQDGSIYYACATSPGSRSAAWKSLGAVGRMQARRLRDEFVIEVRRGRVRDSSRERRNATFADVADAWLAAQAALVDVGELAQRTFDGYELSVRRHLRPFFGSRPLRAIAPNDLVAWHAAQRRSGAATWSIKGRWNALRGVLAYAVRVDLLEVNPADALTAREKPKPGPSRKRFLTEQEMRSLLDTASGLHHALVAVLLVGGNRKVPLPPARSSAPGVRASAPLRATTSSVRSRTAHLRNGRRGALRATWLLGVERRARHGLPAGVPPGAAPRPSDLRAPHRPRLRSLRIRPGRRWLVRPILMGAARFERATSRV